MNRRELIKFGGVALTWLGFGNMPNVARQIKEVPLSDGILKFGMEKNLVNKLIEEGKTIAEFQNYMRPENCLKQCNVTLQRPQIEVHFFERDGIEYIGKIYNNPVEIMFKTKDDYILFHDNLWFRKDPVYSLGGNHAEACADALAIDADQNPRRGARTTNTKVFFICNHEEWCFSEPILVGKYDPDSLTTKIEGFGLGFNYVANP